MPTVIDTSNRIDLGNGLRAAHIELHLPMAYDGEFTKKFSAKIKAVNGRFNSHCGTSPRFVNLPATPEGIKLAEELIAYTFTDTVIFRSITGWPRHLMPTCPGVVSRKGRERIPSLEEARQRCAASLEQHRLRNLEQLGASAHTPVPGFQIDPFARMNDLQHKFKIVETLQA